MRVRRFIIPGVPTTGDVAVAAPIAAGPPMSNAWSRSGAWAASAIQIRFTRLHKSHRGACTSTSDTTRNQPNFKALYDFYRLFRAPGVGHCGGGTTPDGSLAPQPQNLFGSLVDWVEHGQAPDQILTAGGKVNRPLCLYPKTAKGGGCGGNLEKKKTVCADVLVKYKNEETGELDFTGTGVNQQICEQAARHKDDEQDQGQGADEDH